MTTLMPLPIVTLTASETGAREEDNSSQALVQRGRAVRRRIAKVEPMPWLTER